MTQCESDYYTQQRRVCQKTAKFRNDKSKSPPHCPGPWLRLMPECLCLNKTESHSDYDEGYVEFQSQSYDFYFSNSRIENGLDGEKVKNRERESTMSGCIECELDTIHSPIKKGMLHRVNKSF